MAAQRARVVTQFTRQAVPFSNAASMRDEQALQRLVGAAQVGPVDHILDVACGPGLVACAFARHARHVHGIDLTPAMVERARVVAKQAGIRNATFEQGDVNTLPFRDGLFAVVVCRFGFHHFVEPLAVLLEMKRVCARGGRIVVADVVASADPARARRFNAMETLRDPSHVRALPRAEFHRLFTAAGLPRPTETHWNFDAPLDGLLDCSFPAEGGRELIREMVDDAMASDGLGLRTRIEAGRVLLTYQTVILVAQAP